MNERRWWTAAAVATVNALVSAGFSVGSLAAEAKQTPAHLLAMYAAARSVPLAIFAVFYLIRRASTERRALASVLALVQACDALVGVASHDLGKTVGPAVLALLTLATLRGLPLTSAGRTPA